MSYNVNIEFYHKYRCATVIIPHKFISDRWSIWSMESAYANIDINIAATSYVNHHDCNYFRRKSCPKAWHHWSLDICSADCDFEVSSFYQEINAICCLGMSAVNEIWEYGTYSNRSRHSLISSWDTVLIDCMFSLLLKMYRIYKSIVDKAYSREKWVRRMNVKQLYIDENHPFSIWHYKVIILILVKYCF